MNEAQSPAVAAPVVAGARLRIVEIGTLALFRSYSDAEVLSLWTNADPQGEATARSQPFSLRAFFELRRRIKAGAVDLLVVYPPRYRPWGIRVLAKAMIANPRHMLGAAIRAVGVSMARFLPRGVPIVALDLDDTFAINRHSFFLLERAQVYFKRELPIDRWQTLFKTAHGDIPTTRIRARKRYQRWMAKLRPITLGYWRRDVGIAPASAADKTVDVFFAGQIDPSSTVRGDGLAQLQALAAEGYVIDVVGDRLPYEEFARRMARAWLVWSPEGFGWQCFRHFEAPLAGSVPLINQPRILRDHPLEEGVHALYYAPDGEDLRRAVVSALADKERLARMAEAARAHVVAHHTFEALCARVIEQSGVVARDQR
jgi:glycosyltransferase involved in cell wall biosynthesis